MFSFFDRLKEILSNEDDFIGNSEADFTQTKITETNRKYICQICYNSSANYEWNYKNGPLGSGIRKVCNNCIQDNFHRSLFLGKENALKNNSCKTNSNKYISLESLYIQ